MHNLFYLKKYIISLKIFLFTMLCITQTKMCAHENNNLYYDFITKGLRSYIINDAPEELKFTYSGILVSIDESNIDTQNTMLMLACVKSLLAVDNSSYTILKPVYIAYIRRIFNTCCYDTQNYPISKQVCTNHNINYLNKRISNVFQTAFANFLSTARKPTIPDIILADICTMSEANNVTDHHLNTIGSPMGVIYQYAANNKDYFFNSKLNHIYENRFSHLIQNNNPKLLIFIKKIFDFTQYPDYTFCIDIESDVNTLPKSFWLGYKKQGLIAKISDIFLFNPGIKSTLLKDCYASRHSLTISSVHKNQSPAIDNLKSEKIENTYQATIDSSQNLSYHFFITKILPMYTLKKPIFIKNSDLIAIDESDSDTKQIISILACIKTLSTVNKISYNTLKPLYIQYIEWIFNNCCYNEYYYENHQKFNNHYNSHFFKKMAWIGIKIACADYLSFTKKPTEYDLFLLDVCAFSEASCYVDPEEQLMVGMMGELYKCAADINKKNYFSRINKKHIWENRLVQLIQQNNPRVLNFIKRVFYFADKQHKQYTFCVGIEKEMTTLPKSFWDNYQREGFNVALSDRYLLAADKDIETTPLEDQYDSFHSSEITRM